MNPLHHRIGPLVVFACALGASPLCGSPAEAPLVANSAGTAVCVLHTDGCPVVGGKILMAVDLGVSQDVIVGGQFSLTYDPAHLRLLNIRPGATCDPASPFSFELSKIVDTGAGKVFYSVGENPSGDPQGSQGPARLACVEFAVLKSLTSAFCLVQAAKPQDTILVNLSGEAVAVDNAGVCAAAEPPPALGCVSIETPDSCTCSAMTTDCSLLDSTCSVGECNANTAACERLAINQDGPCDDGEECTSNDTCIDGVCRGSGCQNPSLCIVADEGECGDSPTRTATVVLGGSNRNVVGAQFSIDYDPDSFVLVHARPGRYCDPESPFVDEFAKIVDEELGRVFYSVGVNPWGVATDISAGTTLACLEFDLIGIADPNVCLTVQANPFLTILAGVEGSIPFYNVVDCPTVAPPPAISCAEFCIPVPTVSTWGLVILALLLLTIAKCCFRGEAQASRPV